MNLLLAFTVMGCIDVGTISKAAASLDIDGDGVKDLHDNCVHIANPRQTDADRDGWGDECDPGSRRARLAVTGSSNRQPIAVTDVQTITITVRNRGNAPARHTRLRYDLPEGLVLRSISPSDGTCRTRSNRTVCSLGTVEPRASVSIVVDVQSETLGVFSNVFSVRSGWTSKNQSVALRSTFTCSGPRKCPE